MESTSDQTKFAGRSVAETQAHWAEYITVEKTPHYGTYENRMPEYRIVASELQRLGLCHDELIVDVGAGPCDFDHYLRREIGWRGRYLPIDGAVQGIDLEGFIPDVPADYYVSIEFVEHLHQPWSTVGGMVAMSRQGTVITTPNPSTCDVLSLDSTHYSALSRREFHALGFRTKTAELNARGRPDEGDTIIATWKP